eukprot:5177281-Amphidinium_carterae.1
MGLRAPVSAKCVPSVAGRARGSPTAATQQPATFIVRCANCHPIDPNGPLLSGFTSLACKV